MFGISLALPPNLPKERLGLKSSCDSSLLLGSQCVPVFSNVIFASGGGPLPLADGHPFLLSCSTRSHQMLRGSES